MNEHVLIFDTKLRDGEQSAGCSLTAKQRVDIAVALYSLGVDIIEAGFPVTSDSDFHSIQEVAKQVRNASVVVMARAKKRIFRGYGRQ